MSVALRATPTTLQFVPLRELFAKRQLRLYTACMTRGRQESTAGRCSLSLDCHHVTHLHSATSA